MKTVEWQNDFKIESICSLSLPLVFWCQCVCPVQCAYTKIFMQPNLLVTDTFNVSFVPLFSYTKIKCWKKYVHFNDNNISALIVHSKSNKKTRLNWETFSLEKWNKFQQSDEIHVHTDTCIASNFIKFQLTILLTMPALKYPSLCVRVFHVECSIQLMWECCMSFSVKLIVFRLENAFYHCIVFVSLHT